MDDFARQGHLGGGNGMAALAIIRALLRAMSEEGIVNSDKVILDALDQISPANNDRVTEARRLIEELKESM